MISSYLIMHLLALFGKALLLCAVQYKLMLQYAMCIYMPYGCEYCYMSLNPDSQGSERPVMQLKGQKVLSSCNLLTSKHVNLSIVNRLPINSMSIRF